MSRFVCSHQGGVDELHSRANWELCRELSKRTNTHRSSAEHNSSRDAAAYPLCYNVPRGAHRVERQSCKQPSTRAEIHAADRCQQLWIISWHFSAVSDFQYWRRVSAPSDETRRDWKPDGEAGQTHTHTHTHTHTYTSVNLSTVGRVTYHPLVRRSENVHTTVKINARRPTAAVWTRSLATANRRRVIVRVT